MSLMSLIGRSDSISSAAHEAGGIDRTLRDTRVSAQFRRDLSELLHHFIGQPDAATIGQSLGHLFAEHLPVQIGPAAAEDPFFFIIIRRVERGGKLRQQQRLKLSRRAACRISIAVGSRGARR